MSKANLPAAIAFELWLRCSTCWPAQIRALAAPPLKWQLALNQAIGLSKPCQSYSSVAANLGQVRELEFLLVDLLTATDQLRGDRLTGSRPVFPGLVLHDESVRTPVWSVNKMGLLIFKCTKTRRAPSRTACSSDLDAADVDLNPSWHTAELDPSALNGEIQTVAREVQARDLDALPQIGR